MERKGVITMKGNPLTLVGNELKEGDKAPDFVVLNENMETRTLDSYKGKYKVISVTPSLDTPVCDLQLQWFNEDASSEPDDVVVLNISMDLPFAIKRFCAAKGIKNVEVLSDHREASFGQNWGVLIKELRLLARSIFIVDKNDVVRYVQIVKEQTNEPDYEDAIKALRDLVKE
ncbi:thiol peroxidase (atypical 2-Cys peroxiredoxin) [Thermovirga lienii DSM 17291]|jgi:thiol peroxidase|uniref:Thiol peroxidase n=1 Tax=Thermovirga lienii (strain ATCC BAA-1197 / DSM 17291 / Cas60314) TaxID=580340 RepID=G7V7B6_THELD|nr:thiol peroxidase [Thermovirga lienii]MDN5319202.1 thioredoxin-dependent peroxiredoxin [Thermovirga sp.]AER67232.1 thiol peroxidase (atypical 2-Cys peroxiredoxin) [Thermovirga lienii DSM 17291]KUK42922.1 MAG: putative thiol peroxidase [Thermovirga lienii]MDN5368392.1 thioredoxin-dependent peroxiredoxin [Thermovirga sp.]HCD72111.1 thiol peroxidase [Thermovirga lienii]